MDVTTEKMIRIIKHDRNRYAESIVWAVIDADQRTLVFKAPDGSQFIGVYHFVQYRVDYDTYHIIFLLMYPLTDDYQKMLDDAIAQNLELMKRTTYVRTLSAGQGRD